LCRRGFVLSHAYSIRRGFVPVPPINMYSITGRIGTSITMAALAATDGDHFKP